MRSPWTESKVEFLKAHYGGPMSSTQIAKRLGMTRNAVIGKAGRLGLSTPADMLCEEHYAGKARGAAVANRKRWGRT